MAKTQGLQPSLAVFLANEWGDELATGLEELGHVLTMLEDDQCTSGRKPHVLILKGRPGLVPLLTRFKKNLRTLPERQAQTPVAEQLRSLSFLDGKSHRAAARAAEPKILALAPMFTDALMDSFNLRYEHPAVAKVAKYCGACGIGTFIKHRSLRRFVRQLAMRELRSSQPSLLSP